MRNASSSVLHGLSACCVLPRLLHAVVPDKLLYSSDALALPEEGVSVATAIGKDVKIITK